MVLSREALWRTATCEASRPRNFSSTPWEVEKVSLIPQSRPPPQVCGLPHNRARGLRHTFLFMHARWRTAMHSHACAFVLALLSCTLEEEKAGLSRRPC